MHGKVMSCLIDGVDLVAEVVTLCRCVSGRDVEVDVAEC
jgi:hypothetical protein